MTAQLPRFFIPSRDARITQDAQPLAYVLDTFVLEQSGVHSDVVVGVTRLGQLRFVQGTEHAQLTEQARAQLHFHELAQPRKRVIVAESLTLFALALVEHISNPADLNDPVCLYGVAHPVVAQGEPCQGQLTITRGDLLQGFLNARPWAFHYSSQLHSQSLCHHALVPGSRSEDLQQGHGLVLVYPIAPLEVADDDLDNGSVVELVLGDTLDALRVDIERREAERSALSKLFVGSQAKLLAFEPGASRELLFARAQAALDLLPGWPSERSIELFKRVHVHDARASSPGAVHIPRSSATPTPRAPVRTPIPIKVERPKPPDWTQDFLRKHLNQGAQVKYSTLPTSPQRAPAKPSQPEWMSDFAHDPKIANQPANTPKNGADKAERPAWMDDFEDE